MNGILAWMGFRVMMDMTLYQMKEQLHNLSGEMATAKGELARLASDPAAKMDDIRKAKARAEDLKERHDLLKSQHDEMEAEERARMAAQPKNLGADGKMSKQEARGRFYQTALNGGNVRELPKMAYEQLGAIPAGSADQGSGSNLLPTNLSNELIMEPLVNNPLRPFMTVTNITGLEVPKLGFSVADDSFAAKDGATAKEMALDTSGKVTFGRNKMHLMAHVSESVLRGTPINVEAAVTGGLQSAQAAKELNVLFATNPDAAYKHMSLYAKTDTEYDISPIEGETMLDAIISAFGDLEDVYQDNARVVMRRQDYFAMIRALANSEALFGKKPEDVLGFPAVFCAKATVPVVGDLRFLHLNFDMAPLYDTDKDVSTGNRIFALTHWYDIQIRLKSAFRLATVAVAAGG